VAGIAAALAIAGVLSACDQRPTTARTETTTPSGTTTTTSTASDKMAVASDKVATAVDDSAITAKVKAALLAEPGLKSLQINVDTKNAAVTLSGAVDSTASKEKAKQVAAGVSGVSNVVDELSVKS
jgi:osmotically-inducible protein OsmY